MGTITSLVSGTSIVLSYDGKNFRVKRHNQVGDEMIETEISKKIIAALRAKQLDSLTSPIPALVDLEESLKGSPFLIKDGMVFIDQLEAPAYISEKIMAYKDEGLPYESIVAFYRNVIKNPSQSSRDELFLFLENNGHSLTEEGYFLAYKKVRTDFYSIHGYSEGSPRNVLNAPGTWVECPRESVDQNRNNTCSTGLHVANYDYANNSYGSRSDLLLEVIVDPKDVVTVPPDYNNKKMRTCRYYVVGPCDKQFNETIYNKHKINEVVASTNKVIEGDYGVDEEIVTNLLDNEIVDTLSESQITLPLEPVTVQEEPVTPVDVGEPSIVETYYKQYYSGVGDTWKFTSYDSKKKILHFIKTYTRHAPVEPANAVRVEVSRGTLPVSWRVAGPELTGLWPVKKADTSFSSLVSAFIGDAKDVTNKGITKAKSEFSILVGNFIKGKPVDVKPFEAKTDTRLNHLKQSRVGGKFVKKNP